MNQLLSLTTIWFATALNAQIPEWIWHDNKGVAPTDNEIRFFRKSFAVESPVTKAILTAAGDDEATVFFNGRQVAVNRGWNRAVTVNLTTEIKTAENLIAVRGRNAMGDAAIIVKLELSAPNNEKRLVVSDTSWLSSTNGESGWSTPEFATTGWTQSVSRGKLGVQPWGDVFAPPTATLAEKLTVLTGFKVELIRSAEPGEGSWVAMTVDHKGRLIISPQNNEPMVRVALSNEGKVSKIENIDLPPRAAMGLLYAFDSLYVNGKGKDGLALYRLRDTDGDDQYDNVETLRRWNGDEVTGRIVDENEQKVVVVINPLTPDKTEVRKADIKRRAASKISPMAAGLVNILTKEEILDLIAYIESSGKATAAAFKAGI